MVRKLPEGVKKGLVNPLFPRYNRCEMGTQIRQPIVAGAFYPSDPSELSRLLDSLLGEDLAPAAAPLPGPAGLVVPHAGYPYSGAVAGAGFRAIAERGSPKTVILLGANHTGFGRTVSLGDYAGWETPLGVVRSNAELIRQLAERGLPIDNSAFIREHSLEVELPFIVRLWGDSVTLVPICVLSSGDWGAYEEAGRLIAEAVADRPILIAASSDFTHYEPDRLARSLDRSAIEKILALDGEGFIEEWMRRRLSICGAGAIATLIAASERLELTGGTLLDYRTSGDATGDRSTVVGYAAISFLKEASDD